MTDYAAEQTMELEALEAILMDQFCGPLDGPRPAGWPADAPAYRVLVVPSSDDDASTAHDKQLDIVFAYPPTYPDAPPLLKPRSVRGLSDAELAAVGAVMDEQVEANGGMPMMYAVVAAAQDWLRDKLAAEGGSAAAAAAAPQKSAEVLQEEEDARAAAARALGTPVTRDTFAEWRDRFDAERLAAGLSIVSAPDTPGEGGDRLTGRQWFAALEARGGNAADTDDDGAEWDPAEAEADAEAAAGLDDASDDDDDDDDDFLDELEEELAAKGGDDSD